MENDLNDKKESRRIRQYKYNLTANMATGTCGWGLGNTWSIKALHRNSYRIAVRSYKISRWPAALLLYFQSFLHSLYFYHSSLSFLLFFLHLYFLHLSFVSQILHSSPQNSLLAKVSHPSNSSLKPTSSGNFHSLSKPDAFLALNTFSISSPDCLKTWISGSQGLSVILFLETEWEFLTASLFWLK